LTNANFARQAAPVAHLSPHSKPTRRRISHYLEP
jgi:hypothetical protein